MNPLLRKEIRSIRPTFIIACLLILSSDFGFGDSRFDVGLYWHYLSEFSYPAAILILSLGTFGEEVSHGTLASLLMLPIPRREIWRIKVGTLAVSLLILAALKCALPLLSGSAPAIIDAAEPYNQFGFILLFNFAIFSGSLWSVLLLRQVANAFWFTLLTPIIILLLLNYLLLSLNYFLPGFGLQTTFIGSAVIICAYGLGGFLFARHLFFRAQDLSFGGGNITLTWRGENLFVASAPTALRRWRPRAALWRKEIMLQQSQFIVAFVLAILHLGVLIARKTCDLRNSADLKFALENFWLLWLLLPLLVGAAAIAEERKLGTLAGQLCLSARIRTQFFVKFTTVLMFSLFFGVFMPILFEPTGIFYTTFPNWSLNVPTFTFHGLFHQSLNNIFYLYPLVGLVLSIGAVSFYVSSFTRNVLQALAPALFLLISPIPLLSAQLRNLMYVQIDGHLFWLGPLILLIGPPVMAMTFCVLTAYNFRQINITVKTYRNHVAGWLVGLLVAFTVTALTYNRVWESVLPSTAKFGSPRLSLDHPPTLRYDDYGLSINLHDGRIWYLAYNYNLSAPSAPISVQGNIQFVGLTFNTFGNFYEGSDWREIVTVASSQRLGIKTNGTLWISGEPAVTNQIDKPLPWPSVTNWTRIDNDNGWRALANYGAGILLIKTNGTLWRLGSLNLSYDLRASSGLDLRAFVPEQVGRESDWSGFSEGNLVKTDDSLWVFNYHYQDSNDNKRTSLSGPQFFHLHPQTEIQWWDITDPFAPLISTLDKQPRGKFPLYLPSHGFRAAWDATNGPNRGQTHWVGVIEAYEGFIALAADGNLWYWPVPYNWDPAFINPKDGNLLLYPLLRPEPHPRLLGNIFDSATP